MDLYEPYISVSYLSPLGARKYYTLSMFTAPPFSRNPWHPQLRVVFAHPEQCRLPRAVLMNGVRAAGNRRDTRAPFIVLRSSPRGRYGESRQCARDDQLILTRARTAPYDRPAVFVVISGPGCIVKSHEWSTLLLEMRVQS